MYRLLIYVCILEFLDLPKLSELTPLLLLSHGSSYQRDVKRVSSEGTDRAVRAPSGVVVHVDQEPDVDIDKETDALITKSTYRLLFFTL